ncbi:MAG: hypothetical protein HYY25_07660 [Candidatus Wallbacteria bacterium]|nr:hypothetical protein [Candidatus Wallbacteria bacterium]
MTKYTPFYAEEVFIANCYGTEEEIVRFNELMEQPTNKENTVQLILLIESIKERHDLTMGWDCCWRCQHFQSCEINWRRGELGLPKHCCSNCRNYSECHKIAMVEKSARRAGLPVVPTRPPCLDEPDPAQAALDWAQPRK